MAEIIEQIVFSGFFSWVTVLGGKILNSKFEESCSGDSVAPFVHHSSLITLFNKCDWFCTNHHQNKQIASTCNQKIHI